MSDKRQFCRVPFTTGSRIETTGESLEAEVVDISLKGALLRLPACPSLQRGDHCSVSVALANSDVAISFEAEVAHLRENLVGVKLVKIDLDSMIHLRNLLDLNTANPEQVRKELSFLHGEG